MARLLCVFALALLFDACASSIPPMKPHGPVPVPSPAPAPSPPVAREPEPAEPPDSSQQAATTVLPSISGASSSSEHYDPPIRVALGLGQRTVRLSAVGGAWSLYDRTGEHLIIQMQNGDAWTVEQYDGGLRAVSSGGVPTASFPGPIVARPQDSNTLLTYNGKRYRGELLVYNTGDGLTAVNRLSMELYLRGVVPMEIGTDRTISEEAAVEAQAIAARSYAYTRLDDSHTYDLGATVADQVYGGVDAERVLADSAIAMTRGLVLLYHGKVVNAPYHANSGGVTAAASEVWRTDDEPYLVSVSDRIPGTDRFYDEDSPKFRWTRTLDRDALNAVVDKYLPKYAKVPGGDVGRVRGLSETGRTGSGRVAGVVVQTDRGDFKLRGNDVRFVLRCSGEVLPSTLFTMDVEKDGDGFVSRVVFSGTGNGHGVGMDQWGAIGRARAGQDFRTILGTYYPGTTVGTAF